MGHSFGAATAVATGHFDKRFSAVVALDTSFMPIHDEIYTPSQPVLLHQGQTYAERPANYSRKLALFNRLPNHDSKLITLKRAAHLNYCDMAWLSPFVLKLIGEVGSVDSLEALSNINGHVLAFLQQHFHLSLSSTVKPLEQLVDNDAISILSRM